MKRWYCVWSRKRRKSRHKEESSKIQTPLMSSTIDSLHHSIDRLTNITSFRLFFAFVVDYGLLLTGLWGSSLFGLHLRNFGGSLYYFTRRGRRQCRSFICDHLINQYHQGFS